MSADDSPRLSLAPTCSVASRAADEPMAGTAPAEVRAFLLLQVDGPWAPREAVKVVVADLAPGARAAVAAAAALDEVKVALIRPAARPGPANDPPAPVRVFLARTGPRPWLRRLDLPGLDALAGLDLAAALSRDTPPHLGEPVARPVVLVCTHGKRDACCARAGVPLAQALGADPGVDTWQSSHLGGHRLAATGLFLPEGWMFGRAHAGDAATLAACAAAGAPPPAHLLRGRCGQPVPLQIVEHALLAEVAAHPRAATPDAATPTRPEPGPRLDLEPDQAEGAPARVRVRTAGGRERLATVSFAPGPPRPKGCGEAPQPSVTWTISWEGDAPGPPRA